MKYMRIELTVLTASKEIKDSEIVVIGQGIPMAAGAIAKQTHAPTAIILTEAGMVDINAFQNLEDVGDPGCTRGFSYSIDLFDVFTTIVNREYADACILGAAQIDKYGNINVTVVGNYHNITGRKDFKLSGSGGSNEFAGHCNRTIYTMISGVFVNKLDYMTSPGWLNGGDSRKKAGLRGGPSALITTCGLFRFEDVSKEMYLAGIFPQTTVESIREMVPWELKTAEDFGMNIVKITPPKLEELDILRRFEPFFGIGGHEGRRLEAQALPVYYETGRPND